MTESPMKADTADSQEISDRVKMEREDQVLF